MGLLDNLFMTQEPAYLSLLGQDTNKLKQQALASGLVNTAIGYLAAPKNQRLGLGRILAGAYQQGMQGAQGTYDKATQDYITGLKVKELQDKEAEKKLYEQAAPTFYTKTPAVMQDVIQSGGYAPAQTEVSPNQMMPNYGLVKQPDVTTQQVVTPEQNKFNQDTFMKFLIQNPNNPYAKNLLETVDTMRKLNAPVKRDTAVVNGVLVDTQTGSPVYGTKEIKTKEIDLGNKVNVVNSDTGAIIATYPKSAAPTSPNEMYTTEIDASGKRVYIPKNPASKLPILDVSGKPIAAADYQPVRQKPLLPPAVQKAEDDDYEKITSANTIVRSTGEMINSFAKGEIPTSVIGKTSAYLASATGISANDPNVIAYKDFDRFKTKLVNESLRLNKGTQTEGDAVRAIKELNSAASPQDAISALTQLQWYNSQAIENASKNVLRRRTNSGLPPPEVMPEKPDIQALQIPAGVDGVIIIKRLPVKFLEKAPIQLPSTSIKDAKFIYDALPKNARYVDIDQETGQPIKNADGTFRIAVKQ
jgi:hypothetical protein